MEIYDNWKPGTPLSQMGKALSVDLKIEQHQEFKGDFPGGRMLVWSLLHLEPMSHNGWLKPECPRACAAQQEKPYNGKPVYHDWRVAPTCRN